MVVALLHVLLGSSTGMCFGHCFCYGGILTSAKLYPLLFELLILIGPWAAKFMTHFRTPILGQIRAILAVLKTWCCVYVVWNKFDSQAARRSWTNWSSSWSSTTQKSGPGANCPRSAASARRQCQAHGTCTAHAQLSVHDRCRAATSTTCYATWVIATYMFNNSPI